VLFTKKKEEEKKEEEEEEEERKKKKKKRKTKMVENKPWCPCQWKREPHQKIQRASQRGTCARWGAG